MRALHHIQSGVTGTDLWMLAVILGGILLLIFLFVAVIRRHDTGSNGLTPVEKKTLSREQKEILMMLRQHGGTMIQTEVADNTAGDLPFVVDLLLELERKGKIQRFWNADKGAFLVSAIN
jgi:hypothetical protein